MRFGWGTALGLVLGGAILAYVGVVQLLAEVCERDLAGECVAAYPWWQGGGLLAFGGILLLAGVARLVKLWNARERAV